MGFTPAGAVEVFQHDPDRDPDDQWFWEEAVGMVPLLAAAWDINPHQHDDMFRRIFGYAAPGTENDISEEFLSPIAMNRGLPEDISFLVRLSHDDCGTTRGDTWVLWQELKKMDLSQIEIQTGKQVVKEWWILFDIMTSLAKWYDEDKIRLTVWWTK